MKEKAEKMKIKKVIPYLAIILILITGFILLRNMDWGAMGKDQSVPAVSKITVEICKVETLAIRPVITYDATLLAGEEGVVGADVPGKVVQILFNEGDPVKKGTPLIVLDSQDINDQLQAAQAQLEAVQASLPKAEANTVISERNYNNAKALFEAGAVSSNDLSDAETALKVAEADLNALKSNIAASRSVVDRLRHNLDNTVIKAPVDGVVEEKNVAIGAYVAPGVALAMVKNTSTIQALIKIPQEDASKVKVGQQAKIRVIGDSHEYNGTVSYISTAASMASRTFMAKVDVPNKNNQLKSGIYANVDIVSDDEASLLVIPLKAVAGSEGGYYVFIEDNGVARRTGVTLGQIYDDLVEIKSGLTGGAGVICSNINALQDGDLITAAAEREE